LKFTINIKHLAKFPLITITRTMSKARAPDRDRAHRRWRKADKNRNLRQRVNWRRRNQVSRWRPVIMETQELKRLKNCSSTHSKQFRKRTDDLVWKHASVLSRPCPSLMGDQCLGTRAATGPGTQALQDRAVSALRRFRFGLVSVFGVWSQSSGLEWKVGRSDGEDGMDKTTTASLQAMQSSSTTTPSFSLITKYTNRTESDTSTKESDDLAFETIARCLAGWLLGSKERALAHLFRRRHWPEFCYQSFL
jgi:hypothetical protein